MYSQFMMHGQKNIKFPDMLFHSSLHKCQENLWSTGMAVPTVTH